MLKLIKLEMRKLKFRGYLRNAFIANVIIILWCMVSKGGHEEGYINYRIAFIDIGTYVRVTFIIFAAVLMSRMIIDEYRNKTISVLFTYPIPRKRLLTAKLILLSLITFMMIFLSNIFVAVIFLLGEAYFKFIPEQLSSKIIIEETTRGLIFAIAAMGVSLIPLFFGMLRKSLPATLVSSFALSQVYMAFMNSNLVYDNFITSITISLAWIVVGIIMAVLAIKNVESEDINP